MALYVPGLSEIVEFATDKFTDFRIAKIKEQTVADIKKASRGNPTLERVQTEEFFRDLAGLRRQQAEDLRKQREADRAGTSTLVKWIVVAVAFVSIAYVVRLLKRG